MLEQVGPAMGLKGAVMRSIFCPTCQSILDVRRAVEVTVYVKGEEKTGAPLVCTLACSTCHDQKWPAIYTASVEPYADRLTIEIVDGREIDWAVMSGVLR